jgi:hypothetical protein
MNGAGNGGPTHDMFARHSWINAPFFLAGTLKILYDLLLYKEFAAIQAPEER